MLLCRDQFKSGFSRPVCLNYQNGLVIESTVFLSSVFILLNFNLDRKIKNKILHLVFSIACFFALLAEKSILVCRKIYRNQFK